MLVMKRKLKKPRPPRRANAAGARRAVATSPAYAAVQQHRAGGGRTMDVGNRITEEVATAAPSTAAARAGSRGACKSILPTQIDHCGCLKIDFSARQD